MKQLYVELTPTGAIATFRDEECQEVTVVVDSASLRTRLAAAPATIKNPAYLDAKREKVEAEAAFETTRDRTPRPKTYVQQIEACNDRITAADTALRETPVSIPNPAHAPVAASIFAAAEKQLAATK